LRQLFPRQEQLNMPGRELSATDDRQPDFPRKAYNLNHKQPTEQPGRQDEHSSQLCHCDHALPICVCCTARAIELQTTSSPRQSRLKDPRCKTIYTASFFCCTLTLPTRGHNATPQFAILSMLIIIAKGSTLQEPWPF
jgi:hypothetical protein